MIKELTFPKLDAGDKNAAYMTIAIACETITFEKGNGTKLPQPTGFDSQKLWTACNFSFVLDGFDAACRRVSKIDSFTVKQNIIEYHSGGERWPTKHPSQVDFPNIAFYLPEADAELFMKELDTRVVKGEPAAKHGGHIITFDAERNALCTLQFTGADVLSVTPDRSDSSSEDIKQVKVEICTEGMTFTYADAKVV
jgi:hypothetical protein